MSSLLSRELAFKRVAFVRYSARTKRENRIQVQLLRDFPQYGAKGEIIEVLPGLMRNKLYPNNGACYIIPSQNLGPRIPVVKKDLRLQQQQQQQKLQQARQEQLAEQKRLEVIDMLKNKKQRDTEHIAPVEIEGLLFDLPEGTSATSDVIASQGYSMITLEIGLDALRFNLQDGAVTKESVVQKIHDIVGFTVPVSDIKIIQHESSFEQVEAAGQYQLVVQPQNSENTVTKKILIEE